MSIPVFRKAETLAAMKFDVSVISTNEYLPEEIVIEDIPEKYLYDDQGNFCLASAIFSSEDTVSQLANFLFHHPGSVRKIYQNKHSYIIDLSEHRDRLIDFDYLERNYSSWLEITGRETSMSEYGTLVDFIGFARRGLNKRFLFMIVSNERHCS
jgi:hypothetical protein